MISIPDPPPPPGFASNKPRPSLLLLSLDTMRPHVSYELKTKKSIRLKVCDCVQSTTYISHLAQSVLVSAK